MKPKHLAIPLLFLILSGCQFAGSSLFPLRLAYIEQTADIDSYLDGSVEDVRMNVLFNGQNEYLFVLDQPPSGDNRLLIFDENLDLRFSGTASQEGVVGEFGPLMMLAANFDFIIGDVSIAPDGTFGSPPPGPFLPADPRVGFSNYVDTNWIMDVTDDGSHFFLDIEEYDTTWAPGPSGMYRISPSDPNTSPAVEDVLYLEDTDEILVAIHFDPSNDIVLFLFDGPSFPGALITPTNSWIEDGIYVEPLPDSIADVMRDSVFFTTDGFVYYDLREKRLKRFAGDESNLGIETEGGKPRFAFSLLGDTYYYVDPGRGELYKMGTWW